MTWTFIVPNSNRIVPKRLTKMPDPIFFFALQSTKANQLDEKNEHNDFGWHTNNVNKMCANLKREREKNYSFDDWINFYLNMCVTDFIAYRKPYISADDHDCSFYLFVFFCSFAICFIRSRITSNPTHQIDRLCGVCIDDMTNSSESVCLAIYFLRSPCLFSFKNWWELRRASAMLCLKLAYRKRCLIACVFA